MFNPQHKAFLSSYLLMGYLTCFAPAGLSQSANQGGQLGQSNWQTLNSVPNQQTSSLGQSEWQTSGGNTSGSSQVPGLTANPANNASLQTGSAASNTGQNPWQNPSAGMSQYQSNSQSTGQNSAGYGLSPWQQPQSAVQTNVNQNANSQQNSDYYYGQVNQGQQSPYAFNNGQYQQGQVSNSTQPNNQSSNNLPPASSIPPQQTQTQKSQGGLKKTLAGLARTATQAAGMGVGVAAPLAGVYMMSRAMTNTVPSYGYPSAMPYGGGYGGYGGYPAPMPYAAPNYAMMNMAPMYSSALSGLSSFMTH